MCIRDSLPIMKKANETIFEPYCLAKPDLQVKYVDVYKRQSLGLMTTFASISATEEQSGMEPMTPVLRKSTPIQH